MQTHSKKLLSILIPVADEAANIAPITTELVDALAQIDAIKNNYEILFIDDASRDNTRSEIETLMQQHPHIRLICHTARYGKSQGLWNGAKAAKGDWILTMDGDGQNDPSDFANLLRTAWENGHDKNVLVCGIRRNRQDTTSKRAASRFANALRRALLKDDCADIACGLKVFRRDVFLTLPYFDNMHRFFPPLFALYNQPVKHVMVNDRLRAHGVSKYNNIMRAWVGIFDLIGVMWLQRRYQTKQKPAVETHTQQQRDQAAA
jgi:dolichol-phosphate mannosyltransferase